MGVARVRFNATELPFIISQYRRNRELPAARCLITSSQWRFVAIRASGWYYCLDYLVGPAFIIFATH